MSKLIPLSTGQRTIVDDQDYDFLTQWRWTNTKKGYVQRSAYPEGRDKPIVVLMHRLIMNPPASASVDHIDGNPLNNCRSNLRICTHENNVRNRKPHKRRVCQTAYKGIFYIKENRKWKARICVRGKQAHLGCFTSELDAAKAYDAAAREHFGEFARLNFPADQPEPAAVAD